MSKSTSLYIDASHGVSGDMLLGAFLDLGFPFHELIKMLSDLHIASNVVSIKKVRKGHFAGIHVEYKSDLRLHTFKDVKRCITRSMLGAGFKKKALHIIEDFFDAEAVIHKEKKAMISLDETSNIDFIIEICGALKAIEYFDPEQIYCSAINVGAGLVKTEHGIMPVPAPVTLNLLKNIPVFTEGTHFELTTPTGALLVKHIAQRFESLPPMVVTKVGIGAGTANIPHHSNVLRIMLGTVPEVQKEKIMIIETNVDNVSSEVLGNVMELAFDHGALDVFFTPILMKKNRPAFKLSLICAYESVQDLIHLLFTETSTLGVRFWESQRMVLERKTVKIETRFGPVSIKEGYYGKTLLCANPEFEDCKRIAQLHRIPLKKVYSLALECYYRKHPK